MDRRTFTGIAGSVAVGWLAADRTLRAGSQSASAGFPRQDPELVRQVVQFSHFDLEAVRRLVSERPALATAAWDWGFGDWETALGAASHTGRRDIAELLMSHGARPTVFTLAMLGDVDAVRAIVRGRPGTQRITGPHGLSLLHHARAGGEAAAAVVAFLETLGDADPRPLDLPLDADQRAAWIGTYRYGEAADAEFDIVDRQVHLAFRHGDDAPRTLLHQGGLEFHPVGAPAVRIAFERSAGGSAVATIRDGRAEIRSVRTGKARR